MKIATDFLTGKPTAKTWSGVHGYRPENGAKIGVFGEMFGVMSIGSTAQFDFANLGGLLFDELQDAYFQPYKTETNFKDFKLAVYKMRDRLDEILSREEELSENGIDLEMVIAIVKADALYVAVVGESHVYIRRGDEVADIAQTLIDSDQEGFIRTGSILLTEDDRVMLATSNAKELEVDERYQKILGDFAYGRDRLFTGASILLGYGVEPPSQLEVDKSEDKWEGEANAISGSLDVSSEESLEETEQPVDTAAEVIKAYEEDLPEAGDGTVTSLEEREPDIEALASEVSAEVESPDPGPEPESNMEVKEDLEVGRPEEKEIQEEAKSPFDQDIEFLSKEELSLPEASEKTDLPLEEEKPKERLGIIEAMARRKKEEDSPKQMKDQPVAGSKDEDKDMEYNKVDSMLGEDQSPIGEYPPARLDSGVKKAVSATSTQALIAKNAKKLLSVGKSQATKLASSAKNSATSLLERQKNLRKQPQSFEVNSEYEGETFLPEQNVPMRSGRVGGSGSKVMDTIKTIQYRVTGLVSSVLGRITNRGRGGEMYLRQRGPNKNWRILIVVGLVIAIGLFFGLRRLADDREREAHVLAVETEVTSITERMETLDLEVATVTISKGKESEKSRILSKLDQLISDAEGLTDEQIRSDELERVVTQANKAKDQLQSIRAFTDPLIVADLGVNYEDASLSDLVVSGGKVFVSDEGRGTIYRLNMTANSEPGVFVSDLEQPYLLDSDENGNLVFIDRNGDSVVGTVDIESGAVTRHAGLSTSKMGEVEDFDVWSNAAMYSLNKSQQSIVKQANYGGGYQLPNESAPWRSDPDLARGIDIEVDYWIYVLQQGQGLVRYLAGEPDAFELTGLLSSDQTAIKQATAFDITDTHLYIADPANKRVLVFIKQVDDNTVIDFVEQYVYRGDGNVFTDIKEIYANPETNQLFVLDGSRIVRLDL